MKRALLIGIDAYDKFNALGGCVNDVRALMPLLARNEDASTNFECRTITSDSQRVERRTVLAAVDALLSPGADVALFYFAGHGSQANNDVILVTQDGVSTDPGVYCSERIETKGPRK